MAIQEMDLDAVVRSTYRSWAAKEILLHLESRALELDVVLVDHSLEGHDFKASVRDGGMFGRKLVVIEVESLIGRVEAVAREIRRWFDG
ncbi:hypothetical protein WBP07_22290 (plasmid) [Novosphingobium sp. BL-8A]|uniref:hypothetical protein n=1 Tax=Novosphingobium sp. BL-8A TaxID=3127639 RepID=UPI0037566783